MKVYTEGQFAASLGAAEWTILHVPPSDVILGVDRGFCAGAYVGAAAMSKLGNRCTSALVEIIPEVSHSTGQRGDNAIAQQGPARE
jgi:hypothetical protein